MLCPGASENTREALKILCIDLTSLLELQKVGSVNLDTSPFLEVPSPRLLQKLHVSFLLYFWSLKSQEITQLLKGTLGELWSSVNLLAMGSHIRRVSGWKRLKSFSMLIWESFLKNTITSFSSPGNSCCHVLSDPSDVFSPKGDIMTSLSEFFLINWLRVNIIELNCSVFWRVCTFISVSWYWGKWVLNTHRSFCVLVYIFASHYLIQLQLHFRIEEIQVHTHKYTVWIDAHISSSHVKMMLLALIKMYPCEKNWAYNYNWNIYNSMVNLD